MRVTSLGGRPQANLRNPLTKSGQNLRPRKHHNGAKRKSRDVRFRAAVKLDGVVRSYRDDRNDAIEVAMPGLATERGLLMKWVLVLMVLGHNGQALDHIRFTSQESCERARSTFIEQNAGTNVGVAAFCIHDDG